MAHSDVVADSSFLFGLFEHTAAIHDEIKKSTAQIRGEFIVLGVTLTEVAFLFRRQGGVPATARFLTALTASGQKITNVESVDLIRARDIMNAYPAAQLDFVDCCIAAVAERLNITTIATLDRRDFSIIRPKHVSHFTLIP